MAKCGIITLTQSTSGTDNFDLLADADGLGFPNFIFESGISRTAFLPSGYTTSLIPDDATVVRAKSNAFCTNYADATVCSLEAIVELTPCPVSPTPSVTPSVTPSSTPAVSPTSTPAVSPSSTPAVSPSSTPAASTTPTPTPSVTPSYVPPITTIFVENDNTTRGIVGITVNGVPVTGGSYPVGPFNFTTSTTSQVGTLTMVIDLSGAPSALETIYVEIPTGTFSDCSAMPLGDPHTVLNVPFDGDTVTVSYNNTGCP